RPFHRPRRGWHGQVLPEAEDRGGARAPSVAATPAWSRRGGAMTADGFSAASRDQIRFIQDRLLAAARWAASSGADDATAEFLVRPYRQLLDEMYQRDLPLARLADESDLLLHVRGPAASGPTPRVSVLTRLLGGTRDQV